MLRALSPGLLTVHGTKRAYNLVSGCILQSNPMVDAVRSRMPVRALHKGEHVQVQVQVAPNDSRTVKNPFKVANISLNDHRADNAQGGKDATSLEPVAPMIKVPKYLRQKKRMHTRIRIVASCANDRPMTKRFQRFVCLVEPYIREREEKNDARSSEAAAKAKKPKAPPPDLVMAGHYVTLRTSKDANELWEAYQAILLSYSSSHPSPSTSAPDPHAHVVPAPSFASNPSTAPPSPSHAVSLTLLRRLARILSGTHPRTRTHFLRLLSVLSTLSARGDDVQRWAWNALIDCAGKGWRRTRIAEYKTAHSVYNDMISGGRGQVTDAVDESGEEMGDGDAAIAFRDGQENENGRKPVEPDIITLTTLLDIAIETQSEAAIRHASSLLESSGLRPTEVTHLIRLKDRRHSRGVKAVRDVYRSLELDGLKLSVPGLNAFLWTISCDGRWDILIEMYRVLRKNVEEHFYDEGSTNEEVESSSTVVEGIPIHHSLIPDVITYTTLIQSLSYNGRLLHALDIFRDMLYRAEASGDPTLQPSLAIFRALFCAFARHTTAPGKPDKFSPGFRSSTNDVWNEENLDLLFEDFLKLPGEVNASDRTFYWIVSSYIRLCGKHSPKVSEVFSRLSGRVNVKMTGRLKHLRDIYGPPASTTGAQEMSDH